MTKNEVYKKPLVSEVYEKAIARIRKRSEGQQEFMTCLEAGICPTCGEELQMDSDNVHGSLVPNKDRVVCKKGCSLESPEGVDYKFITFEIWQKCINNAIRKVAINGR